MNGGQYGISTKNSTEDFEEDFDCYRINIDKDHFKHDQLKVHKNGVKFSYNMPLHYRNFLLTEVSKGFENMPSSKKQYGTEYRYFDEKLLHVAHRMTLRSWAICMEKKIADRYVGMPSTLPDEIFGLIMDFSDFYDPFLMLPHFGIPWPPNGMWPIESARREVEERHLTGYAVYDHNMFSEEARERRNKPSLKDMREKRRAKRELKKKGLAPIFMKKRDANNESSAFINMKKPDEYFYRGPEGGDASEIFKNPKCSGKFTYVNTLTGKVQKETPPKHLIKEGRVDRLWKKQREEEKKRRAQFKPTWYCRQMPFTDYEDWTKKTWKNASPKRKKRQEYYLEEYFFLTSDDDSDVGEFDPMEKWSADHQIGQGHETRLPGLDERFLRHPCNDLNVFLCENIIPEGGLKSPTTKSEKSKYYFADRMDGMRCKNGDGYENATYYDVVEMSPYSESITGLPISQIHPNKRYYRYMPEICVEEQLRLIDVYNKCAEEKGMSKLSTEYQYPDADWTDFSGNQKTFFCFICGETHDVYQHSLCNRVNLDLALF